MSSDSPAKAPRPLAFIDTETTHLDPRHGDAWEIAVIRRREDGVDAEYVWQVRPDLANADPESLAIGKFHERFAVPDDWDAIEFIPSGPPMRSTLPEMLFDLQEALSGAVLVGSNPGFDVAFLSKLLWASDRKLPWHYRPIDIAALAAGYRFGQAASGAYGGDFAFPSDLPAQPFSSRKLSKAVGVEPPGDGVAHTALGDARWARDVYDAVTGGSQ
jgi:DNA polymerase III epsilon subunit-like protein